nr:MAG TPA: baseplate component [Caudoviricetes sp.]
MPGVNQMPVALNAQLGSKEQADAQLAQAIMSAMRVSIPGIIQSFDPDAVTAVVQPAIKGVEHDESGAEVSVSLPLLVDVPVVFPRGGGCTLTFPVTAGDECLVIFADRCIDFWWQSGGIQEPVDGRMHELSDAFCIVGPQSQAKKISGISTSAVELRSDDGSAKLSLNPENGAISGTAPGGFNLNGLRILPDGRLQLVDGSIVDKHTHGGVESGGSSTAPLGG